MTLSVRAGESRANPHEPQSGPATHGAKFQESLDFSHTRVRGKCFEITAGQALQMAGALHFLTSRLSISPVIGYSALLFCFFLISSV